MLHLPASFPIFFFLSAFSLPLNNTFLESVLYADLGQTAAQRSFLASKSVHLFVEVIGEAVFAGTRYSQRRQYF